MNQLKSHRENKIMISIIAIAMLLLAILFTSKIWMYDDDPIQQTPFHQGIKQLDQTEVTLTKWVFNKEKNFMEVVLQKKHVGSDLIKPTFKYVSQGVEKDQVISTKVIYENDNLVVLQLSNLPEKLKHVLVAIDEYRDEEIVQSETGVAPNKQQPSRYLIRGDYREIKIDNQLKISNKNVYEKETIQFDIEALEGQVADILEQQMPLKDREMIEAEKDIKALEKELPFVTGDDKKELDQQILRKQQAIQKIILDKEDMNNTIVQLREKIEKLQSKIEYLNQK